MVDHLKLIDTEDINVEKIGNIYYVEVNDPNNVFISYRQSEGYVPYKTRPSDRSIEDLITERKRECKLSDNENDTFDDIFDFVMRYGWLLAIILFIVLCSFAIFKPTFKSEVRVEIEKPIVETVNNINQGQVQGQEQSQEEPLTYDKGDIY